MNDQPTTNISKATPATYPDLAGKVALVTGGSGGIGAATCRSLAANGVHVAVNGRRAQPIDSVVETIQQDRGTAIAAPGDCSDPAAIEAMIAAVERELGAVDIVCAFAGGGRPPQPISDIAVTDWHDDINGNLTTTFLTVRAALAGMVERERGTIITMASGAARLAGGAPVAYAAAKAAIVNLTQQAAVQGRPTRRPRQLHLPSGGADRRDGSVRLARTPTATRHRIPAGPSRSPRRRCRSNPVPRIVCLSMDHRDHAGRGRRSNHAIGLESRGSVWASPRVCGRTHVRKGVEVALQRMDNVLVVVEDLDAAIEFFTELGMELEGRADIDGQWSARVVGLDDQHCEIALMRPPDGHGGVELCRYIHPAAITRTPEDAPVNTLGIGRIMFAVDDIDDTVERLTQLGGSLVGEIVQYEDTTRLCYFRGPEGIVIGLAQELP